MHARQPVFAPRLRDATRRAGLGAVLLMVSPCLLAADFDGSRLSGIWALPFVGMLLSIALAPLVVLRFWHRHYGKVALGWAMATLMPMALVLGPGVAWSALAHTLLAEYLPFIILLLSLYTISGGIYVRGNLHGGPLLNTTFLAVGGLLASVMGTTGASMLLIRPLLRANDNRRHVAHVFIFFIFIVGNVGGSLTPLGDPPLFLGFLNGVAFNWTAIHLYPQTLFMLVALLVLFFFLDLYWYRQERVLKPDPTPDTPTMGLDGARNFWLLAAVVGLVLMSGSWKPGVNLRLAGVDLPLQNVVRDGLLLLSAWVSMVITPVKVRQANQFNWGPIEEVAKLFIGIFVTMMPVLAMLKSGVDGPFALVARAVSTTDGQPAPWAYFWASGILSSFLDNAPTYLVFFSLAGGDAQQLMGPLAATLAAISAGSVFMGANSYIGNAPNFMVKAIVEDRGVAMPSFFGYMKWSVGILIPLFVVVTLVWFK